MSKYLCGKLSKPTQELLAGQADSHTLARALAWDFNLILDGPSLYSPGRFQGITLPPLIQKAVQTNQLPSTTVRLNRRMLEEAYPAEIVKSLGGVYPDTEIHTATYDELVECENGYTSDAARRYQHDRDHPNEPRQLKPGEDVTANKEGRLSFGGVLVVMGINSYVTKAMFDANPDHEFYVEESYPMDWMYPYLVPFGIIMRVNRQPLDLTEDMMARDHKFWSDYAARTIGMNITYDTKAKVLCDFAERVYLRHNYAGFTGDRKFIRDEDAQKSFSKLRSAIGASIYQWRADNSRNPAQRERLLKEAEFALMQSFAYCPYSEGASRYAQLLMETGRNEDALLVLKTFQKLDPYNRQGQDMVVQLLMQLGRRDEGLAAAKDFLNLEPNNPGLENLVDQVEKGPAQPAGVSVDVVFNQVSAAIKSNQFDQAAALLESVRHSAQANGRMLTQIAQFYAEMRNLPKAEETMKQATQVEPNASQSWYNLAVVQAFQGRAADAAASVKKAFAANAVERVADPAMIDLRENARTNPFFNAIRQTPEFRAALGTN